MPYSSHTISDGTCVLFITCSRWQSSTRCASGGQYHISQVSSTLRLETPSLTVFLAVLLHIPGHCAHLLRNASESILRSCLSGASPMSPIWSTHVRRRATASDATQSIRPKAKLPCAALHVMCLSMRSSASVFTILQHSPKVCYISM